MSHTEEHRVEYYPTPLFYFSKMDMNGEAYI